MRSEAIIIAGICALAFRWDAKASDMSVEFTRENDPVIVGRRIMEQFLSTEPCDYKPVGYDGEAYGGGDWLPYAAASWWAHGIDFAVKIGDIALKDRLVSRYSPYLKGGKYERAVSRMYHVDDAISGVVPCAIYLANGDERMKRLGLVYADTASSFAAVTSGGGAAAPKNQAAHPQQRRERNIGFFSHRPPW